MFKKGVSGNPGGKPKGHEDLRDIARSYTLEAIKTLGAIMQNAKLAASTRVTAATVLLERGWGKPLQQIEVRRTPFDELNPEELGAIARALENLTSEESGPAGGHQGPLIEGETVELSAVPEAG